MLWISNTSHRSGFLICGGTSRVGRPSLTFFAITAFDFDCKATSNRSATPASVVDNTRSPCARDGRARTVNGVETVSNWNPLRACDLAGEPHNSSDRAGYRPVAGLGKRDFFHSGSLLSRQATRQPNLRRRVSGWSACAWAFASHDLRRCRTAPPAHGREIRRPAKDSHPSPRPSF